MRMDYSNSGLLLYLYTRTKKHLKNEQRNRDAAAKKGANASGVGKSNNYYNHTPLATPIDSPLATPIDSTHSPHTSVFHNLN